MVTKGWGRLLAWAGLMVLASWLPLLLGWGNLPDPVASHWGVGGDPDGSMPRLVVGALPVLLVGLGLLTTSLFRVEGRPTAEAMAMVGLMGGLGITLMAILVSLNSGAITWQDAGTFNWLHLLGVLGGAALGGVSGYAIGIRWYPRPETPDHHGGPAIAVAPGESVFWIGQCSVRWPWLVLGPSSLLFLLMPGWWKLQAVLFVVLAFLFARVYVKVSGDGLEVRLGGGVRVRRIPLDRVKSAQAIDLEPSGWGGWGYRVVPSGSAVVLRRGDAIQVNTLNDRRFAVTVDDAATGAALLAGLVERRQSQTS